MVLESVSLKRTRKQHIPALNRFSRSKMAENVNPTAHTSISNDAGGGEERAKAADIRLDPTNTVMLNASTFGAFLKIRDVFCDANKDALAKGGTYPCLDMKGYMMIPSGVVNPTFLMANNLFSKPSIGNYMDKLMPMCAIYVPGGWSQVAELIGWVYDDPTMLDTMKKCASSLSAHTKVDFMVPPKHVKEGLDANKPITSVIIEDELTTNDWGFNGETGSPGSDMSEMCMVTYMTTLNLLHHLANNDDEVLRFSSYTVIASEGEHMAGCAPIKAIFATGRESFMGGNVLYMPKTKAEHLQGSFKKYVLANSKGVFREYRDVLRQMIRIGPAVNKSEALSDAVKSCENPDPLFEKLVMMCFHENALEKNAEALTVWAAMTALRNHLNTLSTTPPSFSLCGTREVAWTIFVGMYLGEYTAPTVSWFGSQAVKSGSKLTYGLLSQSALFNLQTSAAKGSKSVSALILYLAHRLKLHRFPSCKTSLTSRALRCEVCDKNPMCSVVWVDSYTVSSHLASATTAQVKNQMPFSEAVTVMTFPAFNTGASYIGAASTADRKDIGVSITKAMKKTFDANVRHFNPDINEKRRSTAINLLCKALNAVNKYITDEGHGERVPFRTELKGNKLEMVLADNIGNLPHNTFGMLSVCYYKSYATLMAVRALEANEHEMECFTKNPANCLNQMNHLMGQTRMGVYTSVSKMKIESVNMLKLDKFTDSTREKELTINDGSEKAKCDTPSLLYSKNSSKVKCYLSNLKTSGLSCGGDGGMNIVSSNVLSDGPNGYIASPEQKKRITENITKVLIRKCPSLTISPNNDLISRMLKGLVFDHMAYLKHSDLRFSSWEEFLPLYIFTKMLHHYGFERNESKWYDGSTVPRMIELIGDDPSRELQSGRRCAIDIFNHNMCMEKSPVLTLLNVASNTFVANVSGQNTAFHSVKALPFSRTTLFSGDSAGHLSGVPHIGMYVPVKNTHKRFGSGGGRVHEDTLVDAIENMHFNSNLGLKCCIFNELAPMLVRAIHKDFGSDETLSQFTPCLDIVILALNDRVEGAGEAVKNNPILTRMASNLKDIRILMESCKEASEASSYDTYDDEDDMDVELIIDGASLAVPGLIEEEMNQEANEALLDSFR